MWTYNYSSELYHHGVVGMKWGVRRSKSQLSRAGGKRKGKTDTRSDDAKEADKIGKKKLSQMSNAELKRYNERKNLEQNYSRLNPTKIKRGLAAVTAAAALMNTALNIYNNSDKIVKAGKNIAEKLTKS